MILFRRVLWCLLYTLLPGSLFAQTNSIKGADSLLNAPLKVGRVSGKLVDASSAPVSYATITLLRADSSVVSGDLSTDDGSFTINHTGVGTFSLRISAIGLEQKTISGIQITADAPNKNLGRIKVTSGSTKLKEVAVVGERPIMEMKVDKKVFNVEKNITTAGGSATDVLQNVPAVSVDADGNVSLRGKQNVTILIDGKPATLLGGDAASALQSLPASSIESVEVITNPSAKYDAQGLTGVLNIITKKDQRLGVNGSATLGAGTSNKYNGSFNINARKGKWNVFLNANLRLNNSYNNVITDRISKLAPQSFHTYEHVPRHFNGSFNSVGATYDFNKYNSITITENVNIMNHAFEDFSDYYTYNNADQSGSPILHQKRYSDASGGPLSLSSALNYKHKFRKKDEEFTMDATYAVTSVQRKQYYETIDSSAYPATYNPIIQRAPGSGGNSSLNISADYTDPLFTQNGKLGMGLKTQLYWFNSANTPTIDSNGRPQAVDTSLLSAYDYSQQVHAAYVNWNDQLGKFSYQLGLRAESVIYDGINKSPYNTSIKHDFFGFFPSAFVSYQLPDMQSIYLNYSRRTNRPNFFQLMPFKDYSNPSTVSVGNPALNPEFTHNIEFSYSKQTTKGDNIILGVYYQYTENLIEKITRPIVPGDNITNFTGTQISQPLNIASGTTYGADATARLQLLPIWDATLNLNFFRNDIVIGTLDSALQQSFSNNNGYSWFAKANSNIKLPAGFSIQVNMNYESPKVIALGRLQESYWIDLALKKTLWKNKATVVLNCSDIFNTHKFITEFNQPSYFQTINRERETRVGNITFTYRFGKSDFGKNDKEAGSRRSKRDKDGPAIQKEDRDNNLKGDDKDDQGGGNREGGSKEGGSKEGGNKGSSGAHN